MRDKSEAAQLADMVDSFDARSEHMPLEVYASISSELRRLHEVKQELLDALTVIQSQFGSMAVADWRKWEELASPDEFERWVKSRAAHMAALARAAIAKATGEQA